MITVLFIASLGLVCPSVYGQSSYNDLLSELARLYELNVPYDNAQSYDDGQIVSRSSNDDWNVPYREPTLNDPELFSEAALRDQEFLEHSPLWGYQSVSGGTGDGKENPKEVKTDKVLPAYCNPPNPCPVGYTAEENCVEHFDNSPDTNRRLMREQDCPCDTEHMVSCNNGQDRVNPKSQTVTDILQNLNLDNDIEQNPYLASQQRLSLVAKKSPHMIKKRDVEYFKERDNPYLKGEKKPIVAKKGVDYRKKKHHM